VKRKSVSFRDNEEPVSEHKKRKTGVLIRKLASECLMHGFAHESRTGAP